jgi:hypothetical protein
MKRRWISRKQASAYVRLGADFIRTWHSDKGPAKTRYWFWTKARVVAAAFLFSSLKAEKPVSNRQDLFARKLFEAGVAPCRFCEWVKGELPLQERHLTLKQARLSS